MLCYDNAELSSSYQRLFGLCFLQTFILKFQWTQWNVHMWLWLDMKSSPRPIDLIVLEKPEAQFRSKKTDHYQILIPG